MLVVFNFKNRLLIDEQENLLKTFNSTELNDDCQLIIAPIIPKRNDDYHFDIATQNISILGRNVGDLSPRHMRHYQIKYGFVGHLERQNSLNENSAIIQLKIQNALTNGITPILCIGMQEDIEKEIHENLDKLNLDNKHIIVAYEILSSTLKGCQDYSLDDVKKSYHKLYSSLESIRVKYTNFTYDIIFGGGVNSDDIDSITNIGFDGVLVGDRVGALKKVYSYLQQKFGGQKTG